MPLLLNIYTYCYNLYVALEEMCMINKISVENNSLNSNYSPLNSKKQDNSNPNFRGGGLWIATVGLMQACERNPMINVAVIDMLSAILLRTFVESLTNWFAGFEAFRRESSGLIVNCLIPSFITMGVAAAINRLIMPKNSNLAKCWADSKLIENISETYTNSSSTDKVSDTFKQLIKSVEGVDREKTVKLSNALTNEEIESYATKLKELSQRDIKAFNIKEQRAFKNEIDNLAKEIAEKTHIYENLTISGGRTSASTLSSLFQDSIKYIHEYGNAQKHDSTISMADFAKRGKKLVRTKSALGLAIVLPLAASMQYINRWITSKVSGVKGAPIYNDFGKDTDNDKNQHHKSQEGLLKQKIISISSMIAVGLLSMMKVPSWNMFEFKGQFPTMDQARIISTTTFASRMAAAEDKNELRESTIRDICTFLSLYFLGDYAAKGTATIIEKKMGISLLNDTKPIKKDANGLQKFWHWFKDVKLKSSEEVLSKTAESLKSKGLTPTEEQKNIIEKELKKAKNMRSACQLSNLGVSLALLGLIIPIFLRKSTAKKHAEEIKQSQNVASSDDSKATAKLEAVAA